MRYLWLQGKQDIVERQQRLLAKSHEAASSNGVSTVEHASLGPIGLS